MAKCTFQGFSSGPSTPISSGGTSCQFTPRVGSSIPLEGNGGAVAQVIGDEVDAAVNDLAGIVFASPSGVLTLRLPQVVNPTTSRVLDIVNRGTGSITVVVEGGGTIGGAPSVNVGAGANLRVASVPSLLPTTEYVVLFP